MELAWFGVACVAAVVVVGLAYVAVQATVDARIIRIALQGQGPRDRAMMARATREELAVIAGALVESGLVSRPARGWLRRRYLTA